MIDVNVFGAEENSMGGTQMTTRGLSMKNGFHIAAFCELICNIGKINVSFSSFLFS